MSKWVVLSLAVALACGTGSRADVKSGLGAGERVGAYNVLDVTGPNAGKELCYRCKFGNEPVVNVFVREIDEPTVLLFKQLDKKLGESEDLRAFVTVLADDPKEVQEELKKVASENGIKNLPLTVFDGAEGPKSYKLSKDANVTVLMWVGSEVKSNHAYAGGEMCGECVKAVVADIPKVLVK